MQLFYAPDITPPLHTLSEEESKHCVRVLRLACGDRLHITDGRGELYCCEIVDDNPRRCTVRVVSTQHEFEKLPYALTVACAPTKNTERFEWFLEKATEIGIAAILPLETEHSERRLFKAERSEKIITAALPDWLPSPPSPRRSRAPSPGGSSSPTAPRPSRPQASAIWRRRSARVRMHSS